DAAVEGNKRGYGRTVMGYLVKSASLAGATVLCRPKKIPAAVLNKRLRRVSDSTGVERCEHRDRRASVGKLEDPAPTAREDAIDIAVRIEDKLLRGHLYRQGGSKRSKEINRRAARRQLKDSIPRNQAVKIPALVSDQGRRPGAIPDANFPDALGERSERRHR